MSQSKKINYQQIMEMKIVKATTDDANLLSNIRPGYGTEKVRKRFNRLSGKDRGDWFLLMKDEKIIGWCVVQWSGIKTHPEYPNLQDL